MGNLGRYNLYEDDVTFIKQYGDYQIKVVNVSTCRVAGFEDERKRSEKSSVNKDKLSNNVVRAKSKIFEYAICNNWDYFVTLTLDQTKYNRYDLSVYKKNLAEFLHTLNRSRNSDSKIKYLLIPEMHKDGAWHMHGLMHGLKPSDFYINDNGYYGWSAYEKRFGYISIDKVRDKEKVSSYITKYITKDMAHNVTELGGHLYYSSQGLNKAETLYRGKARLLCDWDFVHPDGYCKMKTFDIRSDEYTEYLRLE